MITSNIKKIREAIKLLIDKYEKQTSAVVVVGFTQSYGLYVHENMQAHHNVGQAKFLEQPARELAGEIGGLIATAVQNGATLPEALMIGGLRLQREAQELTPVDTGALKASAFTAFEGDYPAAADRALAESEKVREATLAARAKAAMKKGKP